MATRITPEQKKVINELYIKYKTYAGVARILNISPGTVKRYVIQEYVPENEIKHIEVDGEAMKLRLETFYLSKEQFDDPSLLQLSEEEINDIHNLWEELSV